MINRYIIATKSMDKTAA